jgi:Eukaryotic-type carbonic anhydrase
MGTVTVFLQAYGDNDWPILNRLICAWREAEEKNRKACGLSSVSTKYAGCTNYRRRGRKLKKSWNETFDDLDEQSDWATSGTNYIPATSAYDVMMENDFHMLNLMNSSYEPALIHIDEEANVPVDKDTLDWDAFLKEHQREEERHLKEGRKLANYDDVKWFNYFPLTDVKTEYYFRYSGSQTVPPCYGTYLEGTRNRRQTNHWRAMKDPKEISKRQLTEMHRLLRDRIAPKGGPVNACKADTGAKIDGNKVNVARPLQETRDTHFKVFCECENWRSKFEQDQNWCRNNPKLKDRLYKKPYNFQTNGF